MERIVFQEDDRAPANTVVCRGLGGCGVPVLDNPQDRANHSKHLHGVIPLVQSIPLPDRA